MFTLEQKVDLILRYIATSDNAQRGQLKKLVVKALNGDEPKTPTITVDDMIYDLLKTVGMPQHLKGYAYVTKAIKLCILDPEYLSCFTARLYPDIAHLYGVSWKSVEIGMRRATDAVFNNGDMDNIARVFGNTISIESGKIPTREFITAACSEITRRMKKYGIEV